MLIKLTVGLSALVLIAAALAVSANAVFQSSAGAPSNTFATASRFCLTSTPGITWINGFERGRIFDGNTSGLLGQVHPYPATYSHTVNMVIADQDDDFLDIYSVSDLIVVAGDGPYAQRPLIYMGQSNSPAGLNGHRFAP